MQPKFRLQYCFTAKPNFDHSGICESFYPLSWRWTKLVLGYILVAANSMSQRHQELNDNQTIIIITI